jgi:hypothetical protein
MHAVLINSTVRAMQDATVLALRVHWALDAQVVDVRVIDAEVIASYLRALDRQVGDVAASEETAEH